MLPKWFKEYLSFHKSERRGVILLSLLLVGLIGFNLYQRFFWKSDFEDIQLEYGPKIIEFTKRQDSLKEETDSKKPWLPEKVDYFNFDPNILDSAGWVKLGFSPKQSAAIINYRNAGAVFRKPTDVKKLFVVDDAKYEELLPFIQIEETPEREYEQDRNRFNKPEKPSQPKYEPVVVELNSADTSQLMKLYGIGPSFSKRIVKYRELLGGYIAKEQLLEVYGMDSSRFNPISEHLLVDTTIRNRINVNSADFKTLLRHPYLDKNQTKAIINYRKQHGVFSSVSDLKKIHLIDEEIYLQIEPYLKLK